MSEPNGEASILKLVLLHSGQPENSTDEDDYDLSTLALETIRSSFALSRTPMDYRDIQRQGQVTSELDVIIDTIDEDIENTEIIDRDLPILCDLLSIYAAALHARFRLSEDVADIDKSIHVLGLLPQICSSEDTNALRCYADALEQSLHARSITCVAESGSVLRASKDAQNHAIYTLEFMHLVRDTFLSGEDSSQIPSQLRDRERTSQIVSTLGAIISTIRGLMQDIDPDLRDSYHVSASRHNLATALHIRFKLTGEASDLDDAIAILEEADRRCDTANAMTVYSITIAIVGCLCRRYEHTRDSTDLFRVIEKVEKILSQCWCSPEQSQDITRGLAQLLLERGEMDHDEDHAKRVLRICEYMLPYSSGEDYMDYMCLRVHAAMQLSRNDDPQTSYEQAMQFLQEAQQTCMQDTSDKRIDLMLITTPFLVHSFIKAAQRHDSDMMTKIEQDMTTQGIQRDWDHWRSSMFISQSDLELDQTVQVLRGLCASHKHDDPHYPTFTLIFANALDEQYDRFQRPRDLEEAITIRGSLPGRDPSYFDALILARSAGEFGFSDNARKFVETMRNLTSNRYARLNHSIHARERGIPYGLQEAMLHFGTWRDMRDRPGLEEGLDLKYLVSGDERDFVRNRESYTLALGNKPVGIHKYREYWVALLNLHEHRWSLKKDPRDLEQAVGYAGRIVDTFDEDDNDYEASGHRFVFGLSTWMLYRANPDAVTHEQRVSAQKNLQRAANSDGPNGAALTLRLAAMKIWLMYLLLVWDEYKNDVMDMCNVLIKVLEMLHSASSSPRSSLDARYEAQPLLARAITCALLVSPEHIPRVIEILEAGRSLLWNQATKLRIDLGELKAKKPELAARFESVSRALETETGLSTAPSRVDGDSTRWDLYKERDTILEEIQKVRNFENFLKPKAFKDLVEVAKDGPVVILLPSDPTCIAIALLQEHMCVCSLSITTAAVKKLHDHLRILARSRGGGEEEEVVRAGKQKLPNDSVEDVLAILWNHVAKPVIEIIANESLGSSKGKSKELEKPDRNKRGRLWWCCMGEFSFMPVHAAGIYKRQSTSICVSDFFVTSYTPTLTALIDARKRSERVGGEKEIKVLAAIQPKPGGGWFELPSTVDELREIGQVVPVECLIRLGPQSADELDYKGTHTTVTNVLSGLSEATVLHLGCHGVQSSSDPLESAFILANGEKLTIEELMKHPLKKGQIAILSACHTASNDAAQPDEGINLAGVMLFVGFSSVLGAMWPMADVDGPGIAREIYKEMFSGRWTGGKFALANVVDEIAYGMRNKGMRAARWGAFAHIGV